MDPTQMEGWLRKKKSRSNMFNSDVRRWFKIQSLEGTEDELALCYFSSNKSREVKGWIFLNDIVEITEDKSFVTVVSPARTMTVEAQTIGEHRLWVTALVKLCPKAKYDGETAARYRSRGSSEEKISPRDCHGHDFKHERRREHFAPRINSREHENGSGRSHDRDRSLGSRSGKELNLRGSGEEFDEESDDERRGRAKRLSHDDNSTGSNGSRGKGHRVPNTSVDHRKSNNLNYPDASTAARMHSHISGEHDERLLRGHPPRSSSNRSRGVYEGSSCDQGEDHDSHGKDDDLESYDLSTATTALSRRDRLQISKENEMRRQYDDGHNHEDKEINEIDTNQPSVIKRKKPVPPPKDPRPRWNSPTRHSEDGSSQDEKGSTIRREDDDEDFDREASILKMKKGATIDDMINDEPILTIDLDDSEEENFDFKAEKRRYVNDVKEQSGREKVDGTKTRPPLAPPKAVPPRLHTEVAAKGGPASYRNSSCDVDPNFVSDDWDDTESPPKPGKTCVQTGSQADSNWLEEDFDD